MGAGDYIPWTLWIKRVLECQGYGVDRVTFYQDNESAIKMEKNGLKSCGDRSRHIKIRYFFIKDTIHNEDIELKHCKTEAIIADFLTKPLQGKQFKIMRYILMRTSAFPVEERVEKYSFKAFKSTENADDAQKM